MGSITRQDDWRRSLLDVRAFLTAGLVLCGLGPSRALARGLGQSLRFAAYPFSLGVASGDPSPDGVVLWTRLAPDSLKGGGMPTAPVEVSWEVAADQRSEAAFMSALARRLRALAPSAQRLTPSA